MKKIYFLLVGFFCINNINAESHVVTNSGTSFSPANLTVQVGDTVVWDLENFHNVVEVDLATYNANGNSSNGGFSLPFGGGSYIFNSADTYYYVCSPHAEFGMKGTVTVTEITSTDNAAVPFRLSAYFRKGVLHIEHSARLTGKSAAVALYSVTGEQVATRMTPFASGGLQMPITSLSPGIYLVKVSIDDITTVVKISVR